MEVTIEVRIGETDSRYNGEKIVEATIQIDPVEKDPRYVKAGITSSAHMALDALVKGLGALDGDIIAQGAASRGRGPRVIPLSNETADKLLRSLGFGSAADRVLGAVLDAEKEDAGRDVDPTDAEVAPDLRTEATGLDQADVDRAPQGQPAG